MRKPDWEYGDVKLYCADCLDILPGLEGVDAVVTDPPYPKMKGGLNITFTSGVGQRKNVSKTTGTPWGNNIDGIRIGWEKCRVGMMVFCSFHSVSEIPALVGEDGCALITWYQRNAMPAMNNVPQYKTEYIWAFRKKGGKGDWKKIKTMYDIPRLQTGCMAKERFCDQQGKAIHPCQKPLLLMENLIQFAGGTICDPYMGLCTTGVAAARLGRKFIGIEKEPKYFEIAVKRIKAELAQGKLELNRQKAGKA